MGARENTHIGARKTLQSVKAEAGIFDENGALDLYGLYRMWHQQTSFPCLTWPIAGI